MYLRATLATLALAACVSTSAYAADKTCVQQFPNNALRRDACIEKKIDDLTKVAATAQSVQATIKDSLTNVKIDWAKHPGVFLWMTDFTQKPERVPFSVNSDNAEYNTFNIHK